MATDGNKSIEKILKKLADSIAQLTKKKEQLTTKVPGLTLYRQNGLTGAASGMYEPSICLVVQGSKGVFLGENLYIYDTTNYLITAVDLPTISQVTSANTGKPYLELRLALNQQEISRMIEENSSLLPKTKRSNKGMTTGKVSLPLLNAFKRLVDLLKEEKDIPVLFPIIQQEIIYRLLTGDQGELLRQTGLEGSPSNYIAEAIEWLKNNFELPLNVKTMAFRASMSVSNFHQHFRAMTALSPLQYQKRLRLEEARRLMLTENMNAVTAASTVGYESPSQFNREYSRMFGAPPLQDITKLRKSSAKK
ncbi:MAG: AraC family transcriptional regulator [Desulfuromonadales bacterium]|nr:AraC family transcriptional regulator [Desulfuromonadales bacterium]